jgi:hypothetical protein
MIREMPGVQDLQGQYRGTLFIERIASRRPLRWWVKCQYPGCGLEMVIDHARLQNGAVQECPHSSGHGRRVQTRSTLAATGSW